MELAKCSPRYALFCRRARTNRFFSLLYSDYMFEMLNDPNLISFHLTIGDHINCGFVVAVWQSIPIVADGNVVESIS